VAGEYCKLSLSCSLASGEAGLLIDKDMHIFGDKQADINWGNEEVRQEIYKVLRWWLDRGLDGFRVRNLIAWLD
jgi:hypothetical protein